MTYPSGSGVNSNQWGPWQPPSYSGTPPATGTLVPPQSPSGSVTGESATWNFSTGETSTEESLSTFGESEPQQGSPAINAVNPFGGNLPGQVAVQTFKFE